jgi:hypothetical protein
MSCNNNYVAVINTLHHIEKAALYQAAFRLAHHIIMRLLYHISPPELYGYPKYSCLGAFELIRQMRPDNVWEELLSLRGRGI